MQIKRNFTVPVADPGFPRRGGSVEPKGGDTNLYFDHFPKNSHEIETNWIERP